MPVASKVTHQRHECMSLCLLRARACGTTTCFVTTLEDVPTVLTVHIPTLDAHHEQHALFTPGGAPTVPRLPPTG